ncbi:hypothetical protein FKP32DRAFT_843992 [Trametes sanguinea]|nr:hypothetical protein FKP32DRAFT_843992 [Trametes sanguinea]
MSTGLSYIPHATASINVRGPPSMHTFTLSLLVSLFSAVYSLSALERTDKANHFSIRQMANHHRHRRYFLSDRIWSDAIHRQFTIQGVRSWVVVHEAATTALIRTPDNPARGLFPQDLFFDGLVRTARRPVGRKFGPDSAQGLPKLLRWSGRCIKPPKIPFSPPEPRFRSRVERNELR